jgi:hypothetical protein
MPARRIVGLALIAVAVAASTFLETVIETDRTEQQVSFLGGSVYFAAVTITPNWPVAGPLLFIVLSGIACLVWRDRKPH